MHDLPCRPKAGKLRKCLASLSGHRPCQGQRSPFGDLALSGPEVCRVAAEDRQEIGEQRGAVVQRRLRLQIGENLLDKCAFDVEAGLDVGHGLDGCRPRPKRNLLLGVTKQPGGGLGLCTGFEPAREKAQAAFTHAWPR